MRVKEKLSVWEVGSGIDRLLNWRCFKTRKKSDVNIADNLIHGMETCSHSLEVRRDFGDFVRPVCDSLENFCVKLPTSSDLLAY